MEKVQAWLFVFAGLDSLLDKDWRGRGFDPEVDQLIALTQSQESTVSLLQESPRPSVPKLALCADRPPLLRSLLATGRERRV